MEKKQVDPPTEEYNGGASAQPSFADAGHPVKYVVGEEVVKKALENAHEAMKKAMEDAKEGHKSAVRKAHSMGSFAL